MKMQKSKWWGKDMIVSFIATTLSIILTFGTAEFMEQKKKQEAQRQMVLFIIHDLEESIDQMEESDTQLRNMSAFMLDLLQHPEKLDDVGMVGEMAQFMPKAKFSTTAEQIFQSGTDTWNVLGNVHFIDQVTEAYQMRNSYKENVVEAFIENWEHTDFKTKERLKEFEIDYFVLLSSTILHNMHQYVAHLKQLMNITDEDLQQFREQSPGNIIVEEEDSTTQGLLDEYMMNNKAKEDL